MTEFKYEIVENVGVISSNSRGWNKELNFISWNDRDPKFDIRDWAEDHSKMGKRNFVKWGDTGDYTAILSDKELDIDWRTKIARNGGKLILC